MNMKKQTDKPIVMIKEDLDILSFEIKYSKTKSIMYSFDKNEGFEGIERLFDDLDIEATYELVY